MSDMMQIPVTDEFKQAYASLFYDLSKEAFEAAKRDTGIKRYLTKQETCEWIGVSFTYLQKMERMGLPTVQLENKTLIDKLDVIEFMNKHKYTFKELNY
ncbi:hypothetical protein J2R98_002314 [Alkalibacillus filiformis]|uniref:Helix-turn-helix domain-containing protein n=1 Tax=Alkalibacillus filiformis TaxID=200990 RepID=A0ABU0DVL4_9BACI|nr:hypothetical protein [Alkalibacillus filiformis]MDQ0352470.1 hypothetical protein [Alkalibacillus filiformis]